MFHSYLKGLIISKKFDYSLYVAKYLKKHKIISDFYDDITGYMFYDGCGRLRYERKIKNFIDSLIFKVMNEKFDFIYPLFEYSIIPILENREKIESLDTIILLDEISKIKVLHEKLKFYKFATTYKIPVPKFFEVENKKQLQNLELKFPLVIRPNISIGGVGIYLCYNFNDLIHYYKLLKKFKREPIIIQELVKPRARLAINLVAKKGKILDYVIFTHFGINKTIKKRITKLSQKIVKILNYNGALNIQFLIKNNNEIIILEVNPRFGYTSIGPGKKSLIDNLLYVFNLIKKDRIEKDEPKIFQFTGKKIKLFSLYKELTYLKNFSCIISFFKSEIGSVMFRIGLKNYYPKDYLRPDKTLLNL